MITNPVGAVRLVVPWASEPGNARAPASEPSGECVQLHAVVDCLWTLRGQQGLRDGDPWWAAEAGAIWGELLGRMVVSALRLSSTALGPQCGATHGFERVIMGGEVCASTACTRNCLIEVVASYSSERGVADFAQPLHVVVAETWVVWSPSSRLARRCVLSSARSDGQYYPKGCRLRAGTRAMRDGCCWLYS